MMEASLIIRLPDTWVSDVCIRNGTLINIQRCIPYGTTGGRSLIEFDEGPESDRIIEGIRKHPAIERVEVTRSEGGKVSALVINRSCRAGQLLAASDCIMVSAQSLKDGRVRWKLISGMEGSLQSLVEELRKAGCQVEVERVGTVKAPVVLTKRQEEALALALREGYYESPKRIHLSELARRLNIAPSSLGEMLKRAEKAVIEEHLGLD